LARVNQSFGRMQALRIEIGAQNRTVMIVQAMRLMIMESPLVEAAFVLCEWIWLMLANDAPTLRRNPIAPMN